jgi:hypothetical protein
MTLAEYKLLFKLADLKLTDLIQCIHYGITGFSDKMNTDEILTNLEEIRDLLQKEDKNG